MRPLPRQRRLCRLDPQLSHSSSPRRLTFHLFPSRISPRRRIPSFYESERERESQRGASTTAAARFHRADLATRSRSPPLPCLALQTNPRPASLSPTHPTTTPTTTPRRPRRPRSVARSPTASRGHGTD